MGLINGPADNRFKLVFMSRQYRKFLFKVTKVSWAATFQEQMKTFIQLFIWMLRTNTLED